MIRLQNTIMNYAWGSRAAIAKLQGRRASRQPEAELWMGAHSKAPSRGLVRGDWHPLPALFEAEPACWLGERVQRQFGQLPFLFKVLAAAEPLSLQAHPNLQQAKRGFEVEERRGVPIGADHRNYKDANHKPELICALTPFEALCGFRQRVQFEQLIASLQCPTLSGCLTEALANADDSMALEQCFRRLMQLPADEAKAVVASTVAAAQRILEQGKAPDVDPALISPFVGALAWLPKLAKAYPGDIGVVVSLMLNHAVLEPGEALYLPAGNLHAYLCGTGLELMANSDNVLRGGLTPKHVDVPELLSVLVFEGRPVQKVRAQAVSDGCWRYVTPATEFELWKHDLGEAPVQIPVSDGPEIVIAVEGKARYRTDENLVELLPGESAFVPPSEAGYCLAGPAVVYRALVP